VIDFLYSIDRAVFLFINNGLANPVGDFLWPRITDYDRFLPVRILLLALWVWLLVRGGVRGRTAALLIIPLLFASDKLSSAVIKELVARPRPCHQIGGVAVIPGIHLLVDCGGGKSFPSSHAVNNFGVATLLTFYFRRWWWAFYLWATLVAVSRVAVGVHYPSDILAGAAIGSAVALAIIGLWMLFQRRFFPALDPFAGERET
jgi:undecaprenyl-diphosphatase